LNYIYVACLEFKCLHPVELIKPKHVVQSARSALPIYQTLSHLEQILNTISDSVDLARIKHYYHYALRYHRFQIASQFICRLWRKPTNCG